MNKKYRDLNKEEKKAYHKAYYEAHKDELKRASNENYHANREENMEKRKEYYRNHKEQELNRRRVYYHAHKNKEEFKKHRKEYSQTHKREAKNGKLKLYYGITLDEYEKMAYAQEGKCATCGSKQENLVVDHDHKTSKVRKLLCSKCNLALGYVNDDVGILQNMIVYLNQQGEN